MKIKSIDAHEILASGGYPTIESRVTLEDGTVGLSSVPYGASAGSHEAVVLTDGNPARWQGKGMLKAVENIVMTIAPGLAGREAEDQRSIDGLMIAMDGTDTKANLGGNAILAVSTAVANAVANAKKVPLYRHIMNTFQTGVDLTTLPQPMMVVIEGGKHAHNSTDFQEFCLSGIGSRSVAENLRITLETYHELANVLKSEGLSTNVGNEGAFAPAGIASNEKPLEYMVQAIEKAGYKAGEDLGISLDPAASEFYLPAQAGVEGKYTLKLENRVLSAEEMIGYYQVWMDTYPIVTLEDGLAEDDWENWPKLNQATKAKGIALLGDDLTVTNPIRLQKAIDMQAISAILIKLNQIGTLTETIDCCALAAKNGLMTTTSHRGGGETNDTTMVDVAGGVRSPVF